MKSIPNTNIDMPQTKEPSFNQNRLPRILTKTNMNAVAETSFTRPNSPVRKRDDETDVNPADMKITGASVDNRHIRKVIRANSSPFISQ